MRWPWEAKKKKADGTEEEDTGFDWSNLLPWNWDFGTIILTVLVVGLLFMGAHNEKVQEIVGKWFDDDGPEGKGSGKKKFQNILSDIDMGIASILPDGAANFLGLGDVLGKRLERMSHTEAEKFLTEHDMAPATAKILTADEETWKGFVATAKGANKGKLTSKDQFTNENTIYALLTNPKMQTMVGGLFSTMAGGSGALDDNAKKILASMGKIVANDTQFNALFSGANRRMMLTLLLKAGSTAESAVLLQNIDVIDQTLTAYESDGKKIKASFQKLVAAALTPGADGKLNTGPIGEQLAADLMLSPEGMVVVNQLIVARETPVFGAANAAKLPGMLALLPADKYMSLMTILKQPTIDNDALSAFAATATEGMPKETLLAFKASVDSLDLTTITNPAIAGAFKTLQAIPVAAVEAAANIDAQGKANGVSTESVTKIFVQTDAQNNVVKVDGNLQPISPKEVVTQLLTPENRETIRKAGVTPEEGVKNVSELLTGLKPEYKALLTPHNLDVFLRTADAIGSSEINKKSPQDTLAVLNAFMAAATQQNITPILKLDPEKIRAFFANPQNDAAITTLLKEFDVKGLPKSQQAAVVALRDHLGDAGHGVAAILASKEGLQLVLNKWRGKEIDQATIPNDFAGLVFKAHALKHKTLDKKGTKAYAEADKELTYAYLENYAPPVVKKNVKDLEAVISSLAFSVILSGQEAMAQPPGTAQHTAKTRG